MNDFSDKLRGINNNPFTEEDKIIIVERSKQKLLDSFLRWFSSRDNDFDLIVRKTGLTEKEVSNALNFYGDLNFETIVLMSAAIGCDIDFDIEWFE